MTLYQEDKPGQEADSEGQPPPVMAPGQPVIIRRILVALDASEPSRTALAAAADLAELFDSELTGLFVEDISLLNLAQLPFARELRYPPTAPSELNGEEMERLLRTRAANVRREFDQLVTTRRLRSQFHIARGSVKAELLLAAASADLLALGRLGHTVARRHALGSTARTVAGQSSADVLVVSRDFDLSRRAALLFDGSPAAMRAIGVAQAIKRQGGSLHVLIWAPSDELAYELQQTATRLLEESELEATYSHTSTDDAQAVQAMLARRGCDILFLGTTESRLPPGLLSELLDRSTQHLLLIR